MTVPAIVTLIGWFDIRPGNATQFRKNCEAMVALRDKEPGHLASAYSFEGDEKAVSREDYENAEAVLRHMQIGEHIYQQTRELVDITGVELHGPAAELARLQDSFKDMAPRYFATEFGFHR